MQSDCPEESNPPNPSKFGRIVDSENISRIVFSPEHIIDGVLKPEFLPTAQLQAGELSIDRLKHVKRSSIDATIESWLTTNPDRKVAGIAVANVGKIRSIKDSNSERFYCVFEDAIPSNPAHALKKIADWKGPAKAKQMRKLLIDLYDISDDLDTVLT